MSRIFLLRHGRTLWNYEKRIQGHTDISITDCTRTALNQINIPPEWKRLKWFCSPLSRTIETARSLGVDNFETHPALMEMKWGSFEGMTLSEINQEIIQLKLQPSKGLDFQPPDGECPREVRQRVGLWISEQVKYHAKIMAVTHKGVIRSVLSLATGWDMEQAFAKKVDWNLPLVFGCAQDGELELIKINCPWEDTSML